MDGTAKFVNQIRVSWRQQSNASTRNRGGGRGAHLRISLRVAVVMSMPLWGSAVRVPSSDNDKNIKALEVGGDDCQEVACHDRVGVVVHKRQPALLTATATRRAFRHVLAYGARPDLDTELQQELVRDVFLAPTDVVSGPFGGSAREALQGSGVAHDGISTARTAETQHGANQ